MDSFRSFVGHIGVVFVGAVLLAVGFFFAILVSTIAGISAEKVFAYPFFSIILGLGGAGVLRFEIPEALKMKNKEGGVLVTLTLMAISLVGFVLCAPVSNEMAIVAAYTVVCYVSFFAGVVKLIARRRSKKIADKVS